MLKILDNIGTYLTRILSPFDESFKKRVFKEIEEDTKLALHIVSKPYFDRDTYEEYLLDYMKVKYQFGKYDVSCLYNGCRKKVREEYKEKHRGICHILYD